jgi:hypothetical protein
MPRKTADKKSEEIIREMQKASRWLETNQQYLRDIKKTNLKSNKQCVRFKEQWGLTPIAGSASPCFELWEIFDTFLKSPHHERSAQLNDGSDNFYRIKDKVYDPNGGICEDIGLPPTKLSFEIYWDRPIKSILSDIKESIKRLQTIYKIKTIVDKKDNFTIKIYPYNKNSIYPPEVVTFKINLFLRVNKIVNSLEGFIKQVKNKYKTEERPRHTGLADEYIAFVLLKHGFKTSKIQKELARIDTVDLTEEKLMKYLRIISKARKHI